MLYWNTVEKHLKEILLTLMYAPELKDFRLVGGTANRYDINKMIDLHRQRFEWTHDEKLIRENFLNFTEADDDLTPICLRGKEWVFIKEDFEDAIEKSNAN